MQQSTAQRATGRHHSSTAGRVLRMTPVALALQALCLGTVLVGTLCLPQQGWAQTAGVTKAYDIPAGPLEGVLNRLGREAGVLITFGSGITHGVQSPGVRGSLGVEDALAQALKGTHLSAARAAGGGFTLRAIAAATSGDAATLPSVTVTAEAQRGAVTDGTGAYVAAGRLTTGTPLALGLKDTPQSVTVVTRQRLDDQKLDSVIDALEYTTGVTAFRQGMGTDLDGLWSRGFTVSNYLVDGMPSAMVGSTQNTAMYDRIEVVRGANGLMSGWGNPAASINLVRKRPTADRQMSVAAEVGSWQRYGATADMSTALNADASVRGRLVVDAKQQGSWIDRYEKKNGLVYGIVEVDVAPSTLLTAGFSQQSGRNDAPLRTGLPLRYSNGVATDFDRSTNVAPNWSYYDTESRSVFASLAHDLGAGWNAKVDATHSRSDYDGALYFLTGTVDQATGLGGVLWPVRWQSADRENRMDAQLSGPFQWLGRRHEMVAGASLSRIRMDTPDYGGWMGPWTGYDGTIGSDLHTWDGSSSTPTFVKDSDTATREHQYSAYATARWTLHEATRLITGARVIDWKRTAVTTPVAGAVSQTELRERGVVVPYAGIVHALNSTWSLYGSYTKSFQPQAASVRDVNNAPLEPEQGTSREAGVKGDWFGGKLVTSLAVFHTKQDNLATYNAGTDAYDALQGIRTQGLEWEIAGEPAKGWNLSAGYTYTSSKDADGERANTPIPRHGLKLFSSYRLRGDWSPLTVGAGMNWQSEYGYVGEPNQKGFAVFNLMARYAIDRQFSVAVHVNNVFDKTYYSGVSAYGGLYGAPRNVMASVKYAF